MQSTAQLNHVRTLLTEYASSLGFDLSFQDFQKELEGLPGDYGSPTGCLLLAEEDTGAVGCCALRKLSGDTCEMKRLYVRPQFRRLEIGRTLAGKIIEEAKKIGYSWMRLDTVPSMKRARALYESLGFKEIPPYRYNPVEGAEFLELKLSPSPRLPDS